MKLFPRIFATFCVVIFCALLVASVSFWIFRDSQAESHFKQQRLVEEMLLESTVNAFRARGESGIREVLLSWNDRPGMERVIVIAGDARKDVLGRAVRGQRIEQARQYALEHPNDKAVRLEFDRLGEEYLFYIRNWDRTDQHALPKSPFFMPFLPIPEIWHDVIVMSFIFGVGLLLAYILANNIAKPIRILGQGMNRLAAGDLQTRISQQMAYRDDEISQLAEQFDKMAQQLQILVEKERHLLHHVSHEMRSPLARMQAILQLMEIQPQKQEQYMKRLSGEMVRMDELVGELLTLSRLETSNKPLEKDELKIVPFWRNLLADGQEIAEQNKQTVSLDVGDIGEEAKIMANESYFYRAFDNVIRNAMKYSPEGSHIQVKLSQDAKHWFFDISDNGPGVDERQLPHIFTAFYRADSSANKQGTGLGLALTKHIVEQHCGKIMAENIQPNGLKISVIFEKKACEVQADCGCS
ncbi:MAG: HAMP domain-containing sensor histidine kinase [Neisseria sp.]|nr:HAMP domain-containing sensor histidine kinase [Neisseria sp.]